MSTEEKNNLQYLRARDAVKSIRGFYGHLAIYIFVISVIVLLPFIGVKFCLLCFSKNHWVNLLSFIPWGIGVLLHGVITFGYFKFFNTWEERKLKEFMDQDYL